ncbi:hypothetical protein KC356_g100 [Hortaea werneckii]|nr:hypothetical protein KC356_g100 [Hortaea werneckii]
MNDFVTEDVAVDAEMIMACLALVPTTLAGTLRSLCFRISLVVLSPVSSLMWRRDSGKRRLQPNSEEGRGDGMSGLTRAQKRGLAGFLCRFISSAEDGRRSDSHELLSIVDFIDRHIVIFRAVVVGLAANLGANMHLRRQTDDADPYTIFDACFDRRVDIAGI